jgi:predicted acyltransferase (DUF342 family)
MHASPELLIFVTCAMFLLPVVPTLRELLWPTDNTPLGVVSEYDSNINHFAEGFQRYVAIHCLPLLQRYGTAGKLEDGTRYQVATPQGRIVLDNDRSMHALVLSRAPLRLPDSVFFESEVYSSDSIASGQQSYFRALLADGNITLEEQSVVTRWVHTRQTLNAARGCMLYGRASAEQRIVLSEGCRFERLHAPSIVFGDASLVSVWERRVRPAVFDTTGTDEERPRRGRLLAEGNLSLPANSFHEGDIVTGGDMRIGSMSFIKGSIKSNGNLLLGTDVHVEGSIVSSGTLHIGAGCRIMGPVIAEKLVYVGSDAVIGGEDFPTSMTAPEILVENGVMAFGTVWASGGGMVRQVAETPAAAGGWQ